MKDESVSHLFSFVRRMDSKREKKVDISKCASQYVEDDDTIFLDCGTTIFNMCDFISRKKNLRVITNSLSIAAELSKYPDVKVIMIGGKFCRNARRHMAPPRENRFSPKTAGAATHVRFRTTHSLKGIFFPSGGRNAAVFKMTIFFILFIFLSA